MTDLNINVQIDIQKLAEALRKAEARVKAEAEKPEKWVFAPTGEVREPKKGEWHFVGGGAEWGGQLSLSNIDGPANAGHYPIYRRVLVSELKVFDDPGTSSQSHIAYYEAGWRALLTRLGVRP